MGRLDDELAEERAAREAEGLAREAHLPPADEELTDLVSNDYLGLSRDPEIIEAMARATRTHGAGARAARLLGGGSPLDRDAERAVAGWLGAEDALLMPSGYQSNLALIPALVGPGDVILSDRLVHASLIDGARLSRAQVLIHDHLDLGHLERLLRTAEGARRKLVLTEGVFSMDGTRPDLAEMASLCAEHGAGLVVDEAHSAGLLGPDGAGAWAELEGEAREPALLARLVTGGKALGVGGAFIVGSSSLRTHLVDRGRGFVFSTGVAPAIAGGLIAAIERVRSSGHLRERVLGMARRLASSLGLPEPGAAIVPVMVGEPGAALEAAKELRSRGFEVRAVRPPTVPVGTARLRIVCHAGDDPGQMDELAVALKGMGLPGSSAATPPATKPLVVVGTDTGIGKTVSSAILVRQLAREGPVAYWKPVQTGDESDTEEVRRLTAGVDVHFHEPTFHFALPASPHEAAAAENTCLRVEDVDADLERHRQRPGTLVIELAGGLNVPLTDSFLQADWLSRHRPRLVLIARSGLGTLNHTLLTVEALARRGLAPEALWLVGPAHESNRETLAARTGIPVVEVPSFEQIDPESLAEFTGAG